MFKPALWILALALVATVAVESVGGLRTQGSAAAKPLASALAMPDAERSGRVRATLRALPLAFEANQGQSDPQVNYIARGNGYTLFLTDHDAVFALQAPSPSAAAAQAGAQHSQPDRTAAIRVQLVGRNARAQIAASHGLPGRSNYFIGNDPGKWHADVAQYACVTYRDVYPGVSMAFHGVQRQLEFDFIVAPGANPSPIRLGVSGASRIAVDHAGNLLLSSPAGDVLLHKPVAYQERDGTRQPVEARFVLEAGSRVGFELGDYDRRRELVIDPSVSYATYLGGLAQDVGNAIAIDSSGNAYVTGQTTSLNFPTVFGSYSTMNAGGFDVFVTKISADGSTLLYSTYVGGSGDDAGNAIAVDAAGDAFVAGETTSSANFPFTNGAFQTVFGGGNLDAFVFELNPAGTRLTYSTYLGGSGDDVAAGLALDGSGNTYVVGSTTSTNFPTRNAVQVAGDGTSSGFVTKLNSSGAALVFSTYLGGSANDFAAAVALDSANNVYVTGATQNPSFRITPGAFQTTCGSDGTCNGGLPDAFVTVFKADGSGFVYSTFLGGDGADQGYGIAVDAAGDAYVTGATLSADFPLKSPIQTYGGNQDAFVSALNPAGSALLYSTYLGGSSNETGTGIAIDGINNVYVTGQTGSSDFPIANQTQHNLGGDNDAFVTEVNSAGSQFLFSTYLGGSLNENAATSILNGDTIAIGAIAVDKLGANIYVTGSTYSPDFPTTLRAFQPNNGGPGFADAFIVRYAEPTFTIAASALSPNFVNPGTSATSTITVGAVNGFSSSVALTCSVSPTTANPPTCGFSPSSVTPGTPSNLTVTTTASTTPATYTVTVTGTSGGFMHTAITGLSVQDFSIAASPLNPGSVNPGGSSTSTITLGALNGFSNPVALTCFVSPMPANSPACSFNLTSVTPGTPATLTVATPSLTPGGIYKVSVTGTYAGDVHSTTVTLTVNGFLISATPPAAVNAGSSSTSTVTLTALNGYNLPVNLNCGVTGVGSPLPACSAQSFSINPVTPTGAPGAQTILTITTTAPAKKAMVSRGRLLPAMWFVVGFSLVGICVVSADARRKKLIGVLLLSGMTALFAFLLSCGGGGGPSVCSAPPSAPTGLAASATTSTSTTLNWTQPATVGVHCNLSGYTIYQNGTQIGTNGITSFNVTSLSPSTTYSFTVAASDQAGMGPQSSPLSVTTGTGATPPGNYTITITGTDVNGLSNFTQVTLTVN